MRKRGSEISVGISESKQPQAEAAAAGAAPKDALQALGCDLAKGSRLGTTGRLVRHEHQLIAAMATNLLKLQLSCGKAAF